MRLNVASVIFFGHFGRLGTAEDAEMSIYGGAPELVVAQVSNLDGRREVGRHTPFASLLLEKAQGPRALEYGTAVEVLRFELIGRWREGDRYEERILGQALTITVTDSGAECLITADTYVSRPIRGQGFHRAFLGLRAATIAIVNNRLNDVFALPRTTTEPFDGKFEFLKEINENRRREIPRLVQNLGRMDINRRALLREPCISGYTTQKMRALFGTLVAMFNRKTITYRHPGQHLMTEVPLVWDVKLATDPGLRQELTELATWTPSHPLWFEKWGAYGVRGIGQVSPGALDPEAAAVRMTAICNSAVS
jgi:hypothetical protein